MCDHTTTETPAYPGTAWNKPARRHAGTLRQGEIRSMQHWVFCSIFMLLLTSLGGCESLTYTKLSHVQFHVPDQGGDPARREQVMTVAQEVALAAGMVERPGQSKVPNTLAYYREPGDEFATMLGVRSVDDYLVIDLACFHPKGHPATAFTVSQWVLENILKARFGQDWRLVTHDGANWIPVTASTR